MSHEVTRRVFSAAIAALAWLCLSLSFAEQLASAGSVLRAVLVSSLFYTHWTTLMAGIVFTGVALGFRPLGRTTLIGITLMLAMLLALLYWGVFGFGDFWRSPVWAKGMHGLLPPMIAVFWLIFTRHRELTAWHPPIWTLVPLLYIVYFMTVGALTGIYPYELADAGVHGPGRVSAVAGASLVIALVLGYAVVALDRRLRSFSR